MTAKELQTIATFLIELKFNNNRDWFNTHKSRYLESKALFDQMVNELISEIKSIDQQVNVEDYKNCNFRIYRDARFSKNKQPYKQHFGTFISRDGRKSGHAGYYLHLEPDNLFLGAGIYSPTSERLLGIRQHIFQDPKALEIIVENPTFKTEFGELLGDKLKTAPKGFSRDFEYIHYLRHKDFFVRQYLDEDTFWDSSNPVEYLMRSFRQLVDFVQFFNKG